MFFLESSLERSYEVHSRKSLCYFITVLFIKISLSHDELSMPFTMKTPSFNLLGVICQNCELELWACELNLWAWTFVHISWTLQCAWMSLVCQIVGRSHQWSLYLRMLWKGLMLKTTALLVIFMWLLKSCK